MMLLRELVKEIFKEKFPPKLALFRVDAGRVNGLSFGHASRCLLIAGELERLGAKSVFLMRDYEEGVNFVRSFGFKVDVIGRSADAKEQDKAVIERISVVRPDCLVVDLPFDDPNEYLNCAGKKDIFTVAIDDTCSRCFNADVVLNSSILADGTRYANCRGRTRYLLGMDYFPMQDRMVNMENSRADAPIGVLLTFGGSDISGITEKAVRAIADAPSTNTEYTVILGPGYKDAGSVIAFSEKLSGKMVIVTSPKDIQPYFYENDLVVCAGGTTLYQASAIGVPCIAVASSEHEGLVIERFAAEKRILCGLKEWDGAIFMDALKRSISNLSSQRRQRVNLCRKD